MGRSRCPARAARRHTFTALLLAPALRFAVERLRRFDDPGQPLSRQLVTGIFSAVSIDPVLGNVALRIAVDNMPFPARWPSSPVPRIRLVSAARPYRRTSMTTAKPPTATALWRARGRAASLPPKLHHRRGHDLACATLGR